MSDDARKAASVRRDVMVRLSNDPSEAVVEVGGMQLQNHVSRVRLDLTGDERRIEVHLGFHAVRATVSDARVEVVLDDDVREALIHLGWQPPAEPPMPPASSPSEGSA